MIGCEIRERKSRYPSSRPRRRGDRPLSITTRTGDWDAEGRALVSNRRMPASASSPISAIASGAVRRSGATASGGVGVGGGQRSQEGGSTARAIGVASAANAGRGPRPLKAAMNRRRLLARTTIVAHLRKDSIMSNTPRDARPSSRNPARLLEKKRARGRRPPSIRPRGGVEAALGGLSPFAGRRAPYNRPRREDRRLHHNRTRPPATSAPSPRARIRLCRLRPIPQFINRIGARPCGKIARRWFLNLPNHED